MGLEWTKRFLWTQNVFFNSMIEVLTIRFQRNFQPIVFLWLARCQGLSTQSVNSDKENYNTLKMMRVYMSSWWSLNGFSKEKVKVPSVPLNATAITTRILQDSPVLSGQLDFPICHSLNIHLTWLCEEIKWTQVKTDYIKINHAKNAKYLHSTLSLNWFNYRAHATTTARYLVQWSVLILFMKLISQQDDSSSHYEYSS